MDLHIIFFLQIKNKFATVKQMEGTDYLETINILIRQKHGRVTPF